MESLLISFFRDQDPSSIANIFITTIIVVFFLSLFLFFKKRAFTFVYQTPTMLTSLGILGTFVGIIIGLLDFDSINIDESIPVLLEGLKVAFISSFVGMLFSIVFKFILSFSSSSSTQQQGADIDDLLVALNHQSGSLEKIYDSLHKDDNSSIIGQLKLLRSDVITKLDKQQQEFISFQESLWVKLQDFADMLSKSATEHVIEALKEVIADFNSNLTEQFGDNFKKLNESVEKLVIWQENYKEQLGEMSKQYQLGVDSIESTQTSVHAISEDTAKIPKIMTSLSEVIEVNQHQLNELSQHLEAFKEIRDKAVEAVPEIQGQIDKIIQGVEKATVDLSSGLSSGAEVLSKAIIDSSEDFKNNVNQTNAAMLDSASALTETSEKITTALSDALNDMQSNTATLMNDFVSQGKDVVGKFEQSGQVLFDEAEKARKTFEIGMNQAKEHIIGSLEEISQAQSNEVQKVLNGLSREVENTLKDTGESVKKQINMIDDSMGEEVSRVMTEMGRALTTISGQFTNDYKKLVEEMNSIVHKR